MARKRITAMVTAIVFALTLMTSFSVLAAGESVIVSVEGLTVVGDQATVTYTGTTTGDVTLLSTVGALPAETHVIPKTPSADVSASVYAPANDMEAVTAWNAAAKVADGTNPANVQYIDQKAMSDANKTIKFTLRNGKLTKGETLFVKMGGTGVTSLVGKSMLAYVELGTPAPVATSVSQVIGISDTADVILANDTDWLAGIAASVTANVYEPNGTTPVAGKTIAVTKSANKLTLAGLNSLAIGSYIVQVTNDVVQPLNISVTITDKADITISTETPSAPWNTPILVTVPATAGTFDEVNANPDTTITKVSETVYEVTATKAVSAFTVKTAATSTVKESNLLSLTFTTVTPTGASASNVKTTDTTVVVSGLTAEYLAKATDIKVTLDEVATELTTAVAGDKLNVTVSGLTEATHTLKFKAIANYYEAFNLTFTASLKDSVNATVTPATPKWGEEAVIAVTTTPYATKGVISVVDAGSILSPATPVWTADANTIKLNATKAGSVTINVAETDTHAAFSKVVTFAKKAGATGAASGTIGKVVNTTITGFDAAVLAALPATQDITVGGITFTLTNTGLLTSGTVVSAGATIIVPATANYEASTITLTVKAGGPEGYTVVKLADSVYGDNTKSRVLIKPAKAGDFAAFTPTLAGAEFFLSTEKGWFDAVVLTSDVATLSNADKIAWADGATNKVIAKYGDVDFSTVVDSTDALRVLQGGTYTDSILKMLVSDVDVSCVVDSTDALRILQGNLAILLK